MEENYALQLDCTVYVNSLLLIHIPNVLDPFPITLWHIRMFLGPGQANL